MTPQQDPRWQGVAAHPAVNAPQPPASELPRTTPPEIATRIKRARVVMLLGLIPLLFALASGAGFAGMMILHGVSNDWYEQRGEAEDRYKSYYDCQKNKWDSLTCKDALRPGAPVPKPPPKLSDAPWYAIQDTTYRQLAFLFLGGAVFSALLGAIVLLVGRARHAWARRQDPSRVIIAHSRALEILVWVCVGMAGAASIVRGLAGRGTEVVAFVLIGLALLAFAAIFQLVVHAVRPSEADRDGFRLGFGRRLLWKDFQRKTFVIVKRNGRTAGSHYRLQFSNGAVALDPAATSNWDHLVRFVNEGVGSAIL